MSVRVQKMLIGAAMPYPLLLLTLSLIHVVFPQRSGIIAITQVFAPYLFVPLILLVPLLFLRKALWLRRTLLVCVIVFFLRFMPIERLIMYANSGTPGQELVPVSITNWNVQIDSELGSIRRVRPILLERPADIVVLEEAYWEWLQRDAEITKIYPYQLKHTAQAASGLVLLSSYPILKHAVAEVPRNVRGFPRVIQAQLDLGRGQALNVVAAHPPAPEGLKFDAAERDATIRLVRAFVDPLLEDGEALIVVGDFNLTEREPAYLELARGLREPQGIVGLGAGNTWPVTSVLGQSFGLLRIDHLFSNPNVIPLYTSVDCTPRGSDHCIVHGRFNVESK